MGKGDLKSKRGKIARGTYGSRRKKNSATASVPKPKVAKEQKVAAETVEKKPAVKKTADAKKPAAKKAPAKSKEA
ncbi:MAG: 30S ribosomal protein THX [Flavobacteriales bacterium]|nr:30S ribosomal protein THX [Flavobacteriales bacterium]